MNRGHNREPVFADDEDRRAFIVNRRFGVEIG